MTEPLQLSSDNPLLKTLNFKPYRNNQERPAYQFLPNSDEPQEMQITTPWGETITASYGDYIVSENQDSEDRWPVDKEIFERTYVQSRPGIYVKRPLNRLAPLIEAVDDPDRLVSVHTLEGCVTVRAGDFFLARGVQGEIWPIPAEKVKNTMDLIEGHETETIFSTETITLKRDYRGAIFATCHDEVLAVPVTNDGRVILACEYAPAFGEPRVFLSGGMLAPDADPLETLNRELQEELGFRAASLIPLGTLQPFTKYLHVSSRLFLARDLVKSQLPGDAFDYDICTEVVALDSFEALIASGRLQDARAIAALYMARQYLADMEAAKGG